MTSFERCRSRWFYDQFYTHFSETLTVKNNEAQFACLIRIPTMNTRNVRVKNGEVSSFLLDLEGLL